MAIVCQDSSQLLSHIYHAVGMRGSPLVSTSDTGSRLISSCKYSLTCCSVDLSHNPKMYKWFSIYFSIEFFWFLVADFPNDTNNAHVFDLAMTE